MIRFLVRVLAIGALVGLVVRVVRHMRGGLAPDAPGGTLMGNAGAYDAISRRVLASFYDDVAADIAAIVPSPGRVLEVGCGPGHLSVRLAMRHELDLVGIDLDPAMVERAQTNAERAGAGKRATFVVADVAALPFADASFDVVLSTLSMHHWDDAAAGLAEIGRVLAADGRALIWDVRRGAPLHGHVRDPDAEAHRGTLRVVGTTPWRWPWKLTLTQRIELAHGEDAPQD